MENQSGFSKEWVMLVNQCNLPLSSKIADQIFIQNLLRFLLFFCFIERKVSVMKKRNRRICAALNLCGTVLIIYSIATKIIVVGKESFILKNGLKQVTEPNNLLRRDDFLISHPVFKNFNITPATRKKRVHLLIIISTAPQRYSRREAIRDTWWSHCKNQVSKLICIRKLTQKKLLDIYYVHCTKNEVFHLGFLQ